LPCLIKHHADESATNANGPTGSRIDTTKTDHAKTRAAPIAARHSNTGASTRERSPHRERLTKPLRRAGRRGGIISLVAGRFKPLVALRTDPRVPGPIVLLTAVPAVTLLADPLTSPSTANTFVRDRSRNPKAHDRGHAA
jgi:hypothetical protein